MQRTIWTVAAVALASVFSAYAEDDAVAKEDKKFEGTWEVVEMEISGAKAEVEAYQNMTFTFKGKEYTQKDGDEVIEKGTQALDPSKKPHEMDITVTEGESKEQKQLAIYEWDGDDKMKLCAAPHDVKVRPKKFTTTEDGSEMLFILKRKKK